VLGAAWPGSRKLISHPLNLARDLRVRNRLWTTPDTRDRNMEEFGFRDSYASNHRVFRCDGHCALVGRMLATVLCSQIVPHRFCVVRKRNFRLLDLGMPAFFPFEAVVALLSIVGEHPHGLLTGMFPVPVSTY
jgi:hypothetical protein